MPKVSKSTTEKLVDVPPAEDRSSVLDGYSTNFVTIKLSHDLAPMLKSLPGGNCSCPHWGYIFKGRMIVRYADHEEVLEAGDAFYMSPGHTPEAEAGTEFVMFSPADELEATNAAIIAGLASVQES